MQRVRLEAVGLAVDAGGGLSVGRIDQAEDLAFGLVDPVVLVVHAVLALGGDVGRVGLGNRFGQRLRAAVPASAKPLDVGSGRLVASFASSAPALLSLLTYTPECGAVELSAMPALDEAQRGRPEYVRAYRALMTDRQFACLELETAEGQPAFVWSTDAADPERPKWHGAVRQATVMADARAQGDAIVVTWLIQTGGQPFPALRLRFGGRLDRPAMAEITELEPPRPTGSITTLHAHGSRLRVSSSLPAELTLDAGEGLWEIDGHSARLELAQAPPGSTRTIRVRLTADRLAGRARKRSHAAAGRHVAAPAARLVDRALAYVRGCTTLRTAADEAVILTDHRILPLSWTRDAYYQALLLLATGIAADADLVADHLRWLWRRCERPGGRWLRSHYATGRPKDRAFQADQQLYPILELADYWRVRHELPAGVDWPAEVGRAWSAATAVIDRSIGMMATTETAADDLAPAPFTCAAQILLWYAAVRLAELADAGALDLDIGAGGLRAIAQAARHGFDRHLAAAGDSWLYATDAGATHAGAPHVGSTHVRYHDANDLPVALAPLLGFCAADDAGWQATMAFAFSPANSGYFAGERGGLGSTHTPAPWTLGDIQAWIRARVNDDAAGLAAAIDRLASVAFDDGMLPEAYSAASDPDVRIRPWFAWPGAVLGALLLLDGRDALGLLRAGA